MPDNSLKRRAERSIRSLRLRIARSLVGDLRTIPDPQDPIFVLGVLNRCGTNFLQALLTAHPHCHAAGPPIHEAHFTAYAEYLDDYATMLAKEYRNWLAAKDARELLMQGLGNGLTSLLRPSPAAEGAPSRPLSKTPRPRGQEHLFNLFPSARPVLLVRNPRAVIESMVKSFDRDYHEIAQLYAEGAADIAAILDRRPNDALLVRYEDLVQSTESELRRIFRFVDLDAAAYNFAAVAAMPVLGSSDQRDSQEEVDWEPRERTPEFDPLSRGSNWPEERIAALEPIYKEAAAAIGYE